MCNNMYLCASHCIVLRGRYMLHHTFLERSKRIMCTRTRRNVNSVRLEFCVFLLRFDDDRMKNPYKILNDNKWVHARKEERENETQGKAKLWYGSQPLKPAPKKYHLHAYETCHTNPTLKAVTQFFPTSFKPFNSNRVWLLHHFYWYWGLCWTAGRWNMYSFRFSWFFDCCLVRVLNLN